MAFVVDCFVKTNDKNNCLSNSPWIQKEKGFDSC